MAASTYFNIKMLFLTFLNIFFKQITNLSDNTIVFGKCVMIYTWSFNIAKTALHVSFT